MRKVIFQKFIPGVETQEYKDSNDTYKQYSSKLKRFEDGTNCLTEMVHVGYFHGFITGQYGEPVGHIEHEGEMFQLDTSRFKFVDSPDAEQRAEFAKAAMQGIISNSDWVKSAKIADDFDEFKERVSIASIEIADTMIAELKKRQP